MKYLKHFLFTLVVFSLLLCASCDNGLTPGSVDPNAADPGTTDPGAVDPGTADPGTTDPGDGTPWSTIGDPADVAGVWEGSAQMELLDDGETYPESAPIGIKVTYMNVSGEDRVDTVMKYDFSSYLDEVVKLKPDSLSKDALWTQMKARLPGGTVNTGNYFICQSDYTFASMFVEADDCLINSGKNQMKVILPKWDFYLMGLDVASDVTLTFDKISPRPAQITLTGGDLGGGESVIAVKILNTENDSEVERLGIGEYNEGFSNNGDDALFSAETWVYGGIRKNESQRYRVPPGKYVVKVKFFRGSFLGWFSGKSESFTLESGGAAFLTAGYGVEYPNGSSAMGLGLTSLLNP